MALKSYAINLDTAGLQALDKILCRCCFGPCVIDIVVVVVKLNRRVVEGCRLEGDGDVFRSYLKLSYLSDIPWRRHGWVKYSVIEDISLVGAIIIECLVYNIPSITLAFVVSYLVLNVIFQRGN